MLIVQFDQGERIILENVVGWVPRYTPGSNEVTQTTVLLQGGHELCLEITPQKFAELFDRVFRQAMLAGNQEQPKIITG